jgi:riboflavin synthase
MFTGIIEANGKVVSVTRENGNLYVCIQSPISHELKIDQSVAHNGICLTVIAMEADTHTVCAVPETISKTTIGEWMKDDIINLERCTQVGSRFDGHIVLGHVDTRATCIRRANQISNWNYTFSINAEFSHLIVEKGSISINGVSLTCFNITETTFEVAIIPYTYEHTNFKHLTDYSLVNIEFDVIGKYVARMLGSNQED